MTRQLTAVLTFTGLLLVRAGGYAADTTEPGNPSWAQPKKLIAHTYNSGFAEAHDTYNGMGVGSDGKIYYVLSSESYDVAAQMYAFDPKTRKIQHCGDFTEACG